MLCKGSNWLEQEITTITSEQIFPAESTRSKVSVWTEEFDVQKACNSV